MLDLIHTNIYGPITIHIIGRYTYFITFIDEHFRYGYVYLIKKNSKSVERFKEFISEVEK